MNLRKSAGQNHNQKEMICYNNFKNRSDRTITNNLYNLCTVFLYNIVLNFAILIFALPFFLEYLFRDFFQNAKIAKFSKNKVHVFISVETLNALKERRWIIT